MTPFPAAATYLLKAGGVTIIQLFALGGPALLIMLLFRHQTVRCDLAIVPRLASCSIPCIADIVQHHTTCWRGLAKKRREHMKVRDMMTKEVMIVTAAQPIADVAHVMRQLNCDQRYERSTASYGANRRMYEVWFCSARR
jgi:hypothetical protein